MLILIEGNPVDKRMPEVGVGNGIVVLRIEMEGNPVDCSVILRPLMEVPVGPIRGVELRPKGGVAKDDLPVVIFTGIGETVMTEVMIVVGVLGGDKVKVVILPLMVIMVGMVCVTVTVFVKLTPVRVVAITLGVPIVMLVTRLGVGNEKAVFEPAGMVITIPLSVIVVGLTTVTVTVFVKFVPVRVNGTTVGVPIGMLVTRLKIGIGREALEGVGKVIGIEVSAGAVGVITGKVMEA